MKRWRVIIASLALAVGAAAGWLAAWAWGNCGNVELWNCGNVETANVGRAGAPRTPNGRARRPATAAAVETSKVSEAELCDATSGDMAN